MKSLLVALVLVPLTLAGCAAPTPTSRVQALVGGPDAVAALCGYTDRDPRVAYRIDGMALLNDPATTATHVVHGYPVLAGPLPVDAAASSALADVVLSDSSYIWDTSKWCPFAPEVAIRQTRGETTVDVLLCFSCDQLEVYVNGKKSGLQDFDPCRPDLVRLVQGLFPDDEVIQALR